MTLWQRSSDLSGHQHQLNKGLITQTVGSMLRLFDSGGLQQGLRTYISNKFSDVDYAAGLGAQSENFYPRLQNFITCRVCNLKNPLINKAFFCYMMENILYNT